MNRKRKKKTKIIGLWNRYFDGFCDWVENSWYDPYDDYTGTTVVKTTKTKKELKSKKIVPEFKICPVENLTDDENDANS